MPVMIDQEDAELCWNPHPEDPGWTGMDILAKSPGVVGQL